MTKPDLSEFEQHQTRHKRVHPKGWEPGVQYNGATGTLTVQAVEEPDPAIWEQLTADWGLDPARVEIVPGSLQIRAWDSNMGDGNVQRLKYYRATLQARESSVDRADVDELVKIVTKKRPGRTSAPPSTGRSFVALLTDWQVGNGEAGGSAKITENVLGSLDRTLAKAKELRKVGRGSEAVYLLGMGDLAEGCFQGDTMVQTRSGLRPIRELAAEGRAIVKSDYGSWVEAEFRSFGQQRLYKLNLTRGNAAKTVYTTENHRWFRLEDPAANSARQECLTGDLEKGDMLVSNFGKHPRSLSPVGIMAGIVFGDGHRQDKSRPEMGSAINLHRGDWGLIDYFAGHPMSDVSRKESGALTITEDSDFVKVSGMPAFFKALPDLEESLPYLYGWAAGYFAADGSVDNKGGLSLSSANRSHLEHFAAVCSRVGIGTNPIRESWRLGCGSEKSALFIMTLCPATVSPDFLIHPTKRARFEAWVSRPRSRSGYAWQRNRGRHWMVDSVEETDRVEEVYCAIVPGTHSFTLDNDLLTGNCMGWYANQTWATDLNIREQDRVVRHLLTAWIDAFVDAQYRVVAVGVPGNHGEQRASGKAYTNWATDNRDVQCFEIVAEALANNPARYGEVHFPDVLDQYDMTATLDVSGVAVSTAHGHQFGKGASGSKISKIESWLKGQALGRQSVADCSILFSGHFHHFLASEATGRTVFQAPASDTGSAWWTQQTGQASPAGVLTMNVGEACGPRGWNDLGIL